MSRTGARRHRHPSEVDAPRTFGQRSADVSSRFAGSWRFIFIYLGLTLGWCGLNIATVVRHWDPYPFIFYTFGVSVLAILMSSLILLAGNRQAEVDRAHAENAYHHLDEVNAKQDQQIELLDRQVRVALEQHTQILQQLAAILIASQTVAAIPPATAAIASAGHPEIPTAEIGCRHAGSRQSSYPAGDGHRSPPGATAGPRQAPVMSER